jgi:hypothetical protein
MKIAVLNFSGNVGKTTVAAHLLKPRMADAPVYSIESVNVGADANGIDAERMKGKQFGELMDAVMMRDSAIVDVGASNVEDFLNRMAQYTGSHEEFDLFIVPVTKEQKVQADTINTITALAAMGIGQTRIRLVFNRVDTDDDVESEFASVIGMDEIRGFCIADTDCVIYANELFERMKMAGKSLGDIVTDKTDYRELLRHTDRDDTEQRIHLTNMVGMKRLSVSVQENLDKVFARLTKGIPA